MNSFSSPNESLGSLDAESASKLIAAATDIALVLDDEGVIRDVSLGNEDIAPKDYRSWLGQPLTSIVSIDSRAKVGELIKGAASQDRPRWRHLNHTTSDGADLPILYSAVRIGDRGPVLALGRDMRAMADLQQRLMDVQQSIERDYSKLRHLETRCRLLFEMSSVAVLVVDSSNRKVVEANPAAVEMLAIDVGQSVLSGFDAPGADALEALLGRVQALGRTDKIQVSAPDGQRELLVSASLFRQEGAGLFLVHLTPLAAGASTAAPRSRVLEVLEKAPDGFVITSLDGRIISANNAFLEFTQLATEEQARGESLDRWLGRPGVDLNVLTANLREHGSVRLFATTLRGEYGAAEDVEISAVAVPGKEGCLGFVIRSVARRPESGPRATGTLPHSAEQLKDLVGRMPLRDLVRETTDIIERMCIEAALQLTGDNRASAAEMLGLSRQSLYVKLRRFHLVDSEPDEAH